MQKRLIRLILLLIGLSSIGQLVFSIVSGNFPCSICYEYPSWWLYFYYLKLICMCVFVGLTFKKKRLGVVGLMIVIMINSISILIFEYNFIESIAMIFSMVLLIMLFKPNWEEYK